MDRATIDAHLYTHDLPNPDPDLIIRTSGEQRVSNFLLWQGSYAEWYFEPCYWPDFGERELCAAIEEYLRRERRFGGTVAESPLQAILEPE